jgi:hypothetical protein
MAGEPEPGSAREVARKDMELMIEAATKLRDDLDGHVSINQEILDGLGRVGELGTALERVKAAQWRLSLTDSLSRYELIRHRARLSLIAVGIEEGMTVSDVAEHWGISRQLAGRYLRDIKESS